MKARIVEYGGQEWRLNDLAKEKGIKPATLSDRLRRMPIERALATGVLDRRQCIRLAQLASPWRRRGVP